MVRLVNRFVSFVRCSGWLLSKVVLSSVSGDLYSRFISNRWFCGCSSVVVSVRFLWLVV